VQIVCPGCQKQLQVADDKLPKDRQARLTCPACQQRFTFDPKTADVSSSSASSEETQANDLITKSSLTGWFAQTEIKEAGPPPRALVCMDNATYCDACQDMLPAFGFKTVHATSNQAQAMAYLAEYPYEFVILDANFDGSALEANPVLACMVQLPMDQRRYMFAVLCLPDTVTADPLISYSHNVNLVVNPPDLLTPSYRFILRQCLMEHKRLYRTYRELRKKMGKDA
jgi:hypothetical protein